MQRWNVEVLPPLVQRRFEVKGELVFVVPIAEQQAGLAKCEL